MTDNSGGGTAYALREELKAMQVLIDDNRDRINDVVGLDNSGGRLGVVEKASDEHDQQFKDLTLTLGNVDRKLAAQTVQLKWLVAILAAIGVMAATATVNYLIG